MGFTFVYVNLYTVFLFHVGMLLLGICTARTMGSTGAEKLPVVSEADGSETTIEIKIKTLDSQTYTLKVDKQVSAHVL